MAKMLDIGAGLSLWISEIDYVPPPRPEHIYLGAPFMSVQFARLTPIRGEEVRLEVWPKGSSVEHSHYRQFTVVYVHRAKAIEQLAKWTRCHWKALPIAPGALFAHQQEAARVRRRLEGIVDDVTTLAGVDSLPRDIKRFDSSKLNSHGKPKRRSAKSFR